MVEHLALWFANVVSPRLILSHSILVYFKRSCSIFQLNSIDLMSSDKTRYSSRSFLDTVIILLPSQGFILIFLMVVDAILTSGHCGLSFSNSTESTSIISSKHRTDLITIRKNMDDFTVTTYSATPSFHELVRAAIEQSSPF